MRETNRETSFLPELPQDFCANLSASVVKLKSQGFPARGRHGFKPCPFRRSGRGQRPPFRHGRRGGRSFPCALPPMSDGSAPPDISTGSTLASRRRQEEVPPTSKSSHRRPCNQFSAYMRILPFTLAANSSCSAAAALAARMMTAPTRGLARSRKPHIRRFRLPAPIAVGIPERLEIGKSLPGKPTPFAET
ncbi:MAG: hypothetical protein ACLR7Z_08375 [Bilophila wadsworthia]